MCWAGTAWQCLVYRRAIAWAAWRIANTKATCDAILRTPTNANTTQPGEPHQDAGPTLERSLFQLLRADAPAPCSDTRGTQRPSCEGRPRKKCTQLWCLVFAGKQTKVGVHVHRKHNRCASMGTQAPPAKQVSVQPQLTTGVSAVPIPATAVRERTSLLPAHKPHENCTVDRPQQQQNSPSPAQQHARAAHARVPP